MTSAAGASVIAVQPSADAVTVAANCSVVAWTHAATPLEDAVYS